MPGSTVIHPSTAHSRAPRGMRLLLLDVARLSCRAMPALYGDSHPSTLHSSSRPSATPPQHTASASFKREIEKGIGRGWPQSLPHCCWWCFEVCDTPQPCYASQAICNSRAPEPAITSCSQAPLLGLLALLHFRNNSSSTTKMQKLFNFQGSGAISVANCVPQQLQWAESCSHLQAPQPKGNW